MENNKNLQVSLMVFSYLFFAFGILLPLVFMFETGFEFISEYPDSIIFPLYLGLLLIALGGISYFLFLTLSQNIEDAEGWQENALIFLGWILIIIAVLGFVFIISKTGNTFSFIERYGFIGGAIFLLLNVQIGLLCLGTVLVYKKLKQDLPESNTSDNTERFIFCQNCGNKIDLTENAEYCDECGQKI